MSRRWRRADSANDADDLGSRVDALDAALESGDGALDPGEVRQAQELVRKVGERTGLSGLHTVVALAGATGSGKSSLFNALVGAEVARIGARRPTTSKPTAAVWGDDDAGPLLDWLQVDARHLVGAARPEDGLLDGLVLLDLPDFDSREASHRAEAERVLELADVFVWVTDPQKYADARLHDDFVSLLSQHESVTLAVLNQADRLPPDAVTSCLADLARLLASDGLPAATVLPTSVRTGEGVEELRERIAAIAAGHAAARRRLSADVVTRARQLRSQVADGEVPAGLLPRGELDQALSRAAGVPIVLDAVGRDYRRKSVASSGWIFTRWVARFKPDPLRRLRLEGPEAGGAARDADADGEVRTALRRSSISAPTGPTRAAVEVATRAFARSGSSGLPQRWALAIEEAAMARADELPDALDQAVTGTPLITRRPVWWAVCNVLQWLFGLTALAGALWLAGLYVLGLLALPEPETPSVGVVPVPLLMVVGGALLGMILAGLARWWARVGSRRRRRATAARLRDSIAEVREARIVEPVAEVLERHRATRESLDRAAR